MQITNEDIESANRIITCETHNKKCKYMQSPSRCSCCNKRICLCNYIL